VKITIPSGHCAGPLPSPEVLLKVNCEADRNVVLKIFDITCYCQLSFYETNACIFRSHGKFNQRTKTEVYTTNLRFLPAVPWVIGGCGNALPEQ